MKSPATQHATITVTYEKGFAMKAQFDLCEDFPLMPKTTAAINATRGLHAARTKGDCVFTGANDPLWVAIQELHDLLAGLHERLGVGPESLESAAEDEGQRVLASMHAALSKSSKVKVSPQAADGTFRVTANPDSATPKPS